MAQREEGEENKARTGFAGLSSLVSDVDTAVPPPAKAAPPPYVPTPPPAIPTPPPARPTPQKQERSKQGPGNGRATPSSGQDKGGLVAGGIVAIVVLVWALGNADRYSSPKPAYSPAKPSYSVNSPPPRAPSRPLESKPPVGQDLVLSQAQISYCLAEDIRMDAAKAALNRQSERDVDQFNDMVNDYNSRCGRFRYETTSMNKARRDLEPYRGQLETEGRNRFFAGSEIVFPSPTASRSTKPSTSGSGTQPSTKTYSFNPPQFSSPDLTVLAIQQRLNRLGYSAGPEDGLIGKRTRAAIMEFQQDNGLPVTGIADFNLLQLLPARY